MSVQEPSLPSAPPARPVYFASLIAGLEPIVADELAERLPAATLLAVLRGKVIFAAPEPPAAALALLTIEHLFAFVGRLEGLPRDRSGLEAIEEGLRNAELGPALALWAQLHGPPPVEPAFRITAQRAGTHEYNSLEIAAAAGAGVVQRYGWRVDLTDYDYDVRVYVTDDAALIGLRLSHAPLHQRARVVHAAASLNATVAAAMCRLSVPEDGQVFLDPMCGAGTVLIERARLGEALLIGSDRFAAPLAAARRNLTAAAVTGSLLQADARRLPMRTGVVDALVSNLPWGRRIGSHRANRHLYPRFLRETARALRPGGRAVLLTPEQRLMTRLLDRDHRLQPVARYHLSLSGLSPSIYVLERASD